MMAENLLNQDLELWPIDFYVFSEHLMRERRVNEFEIDCFDCDFVIESKQQSYANKC